MKGTSFFKTKTMDKAVSRRRFIQKYFFLGPAFFGAGFILNSCNQSGTDSKEDKTTAVDPCNDFSGISENDKEARKKLGYVKESPIAGMTCNKCNLWLPPADGKACGTCMLFKGPVYPSGYCTYWAARQG